MKAICEKPTVNHQVNYHIRLFTYLPLSSLSAHFNDTIALTTATLRY